jgi:ferrous iron transport protein A
MTFFLDELQEGQRVMIKSLGDKEISSRLIEMGCLPGEVIELSKTAPLGCPFSIHVAGYELSMRREEAATVLVELIN